MKKRILLLVLAVLLAVPLAACDGGRVETSEALTAEEASQELASLIDRVDVSEVQNPTLDIYSSDTNVADTLADIDEVTTMTVMGDGQINLEIAAPSELTGAAPDDWLNIVAERFNASGQTVDGKTVSVSVRAISSGEAVSYMTEKGYRPQLYIPSSYALGMMLDASGIQTITLAERLAGNTAGILMKSDVYDSFTASYGDVTVKNVLDAALAGDITFAYTNPYTSATGLNVLTAMLAAYDSNDPLSQTAVEKLNEYQRTAPPVAYTTAVMRTQAERGIVNAMVMERQAYSNSSGLSGYVYTPVGIRHDHPVYAFDYDSEEELAAARLFVDFALSSQSQELATSKGFNQDEDYRGQDSGLDGMGYLQAQGIWKENKSGGQPILAVFVTDVSGSMDGAPINALKQSLVDASSYISESNYVGLVSYSSDVTINLPIAQFDATQRAYFSGEVKALGASGSTATYDAVLVALDMLERKAQEVPNARKMIFVLTDGEQNVGYPLERITGVVDGLDVPVYTIAYNYNDNGELETLSGVNEAALVSGETTDIVNALRNLFNTQL